MPFIAFYREEVSGLGGAMLYFGESDVVGTDGLKRLTSVRWLVR